MNLHENLTLTTCRISPSDSIRFLRCRALATKRKADRAAQS